ncbi:MAG TPA: MTH938/NDUFAF3 family protein [Candidatus Woesebacteria bacterium]|nr:MTH938/NDUFAF3 family protein [Candidatus Woesebacteria bacterium]
MIDSYSFGLMVIDGRLVSEDILVKWCGEVLPWRRSVSHVIGTQDIKAAITAKPELIVIGTGAAGVAKVKPVVKDRISRVGIDIVIAKTGQAVEIFNQALKIKKKVIGLFHLTC